MLKEMDCTDSQVRRILSPVSGELSADAVLQLNLNTKYGADLNEIITDAKQRGGAVLVVNLAADDVCSPINAYLAASMKDKIDAALKAVAQAAGAQEIYIVKPADVDYAPAGVEGKPADADAASAGAEGKSAAALAGVKVKTVETGRSLVLREESALYHMIETGELRSCPLEKEFPSQGYQGKPTVVADAETLCRIYEAAQPEYVESKLIVVSAAGESRIVEVKTGTSLLTLLTECGMKPQKSVLIGGVTGEFIAKDQLDQKTVGPCADWDSVSVYGEKDCLADVTRQLAAQANKESCKKCVLCREGTWHFAAYTQDITDGKAKKDDLAMILDIGPLIQTGAFCSFGQKMARAVVSSVEQNRTELEAHFIKKTCPAGVCKAFAKLVIDPSKCTGCGDCVDECEEDAITGKKKFIHIIDTDLCENCGKCAKVCEEDAIVMQDGTIRVPKKPVKVGKFK